MDKIFIAIKGDTSEESVKLFERLYEKFLRDEEICRMILYYDKNKGMPPVNYPKQWPLQLCTRDFNIWVSIYNCTAGYNGSGPSATKKILRLIGFREDLANEVVYEETSPGIVEREYSFEV